MNYFYGLGVSDINVEDFEEVYVKLEELAQTRVVKDMYAYIGLREK